MQKKFKLSDVILSVICVVFVAEATASVASLGNSQYFRRLFMIVAFLVPYGLISILFCAVPLSLDPDTLASVLPITIGTILCITIGELLIVVREKKNK